MINLDELIYSYRYIKGMITRVEKDLDDNHDNLSTTEIYSKEADLHGLNKTMEELSKKINVIKNNAIKANLVKATITTNKIDTFIFDKSIRHDNNIIELKNRVIGRFTFSINGNEVVREGEYLLSFNDDYIKFLGNRSDVNNLLQVFDVFILPSLYEGFGIVNIEAQVSGLPCLVSDAVPDLAKVNDNFHFLSI